MREGCGMRDEGVMGSGVRGRGLRGSGLGGQGSGSWGSEMRDQGSGMRSEEEWGVSAFSLRFCSINAEKRSIDDTVSVA